jgi:tetratricopeptide (TPR) repeat protein
MPALDRAKTIQAAERFVKAGKLIEAVKEYQKLADDNPRDMNVVNKLGDLLVRAGRNGEALKHFVRIADFYARDGFFLKAIAMYKKVTKLDPTNVEGQQRLAAMYAQQGLASDAKAQYVLLADQLIRQNQAPAAADALRRVLEIEPENPKARQSLAELLGKGGKADEAAREFCHLARAAAARGDIAAAVDAVRRGVDANPGLPGLGALLLSIVVRLQAAPPPLVAAVEKMARQAGRSAMALLVLAETLRRSGKASEADEAFRRLAAGVEGDDDLNSEALVQLARHHDTHGRPDEAWDALDRAISRADQGAGPAPATMLDDFLARHADHRQALARRGEIAARAGDAAAEVAALRRLAPLYAATGERDRAAAAVERVATLLPGDPLVATMRDEVAGRSAPAPSAPAPPAPSPLPAAAPSPAGSADEDEIELELVDTDDAGGADGAAAEAESAEAVFNLDEDATPEIEVVSDDAPAPPSAPSSREVPASAGPPAAGPASEEEAYGSGSRIQEIQAADSTGRPIDEEFISEHLTEAEVFVKYGLHGKAREQLQSILERYPEHEAARVRLKDILVSEGNTEGAIRECLAIAEIMRQRGGEAESRELINEAVRLDPESPLVARHRGGVDLRAPRAAPAGGKKKPAAAGPETAPPRDPLAIEEPPVDLPRAVATPKAAAKGDDWLSEDKGIEIEVADAYEERAHEIGATTARTVLPLPGEPVEEEIPDELPRTHAPRAKGAKGEAKVEARAETRGARAGTRPADPPAPDAEDSLADMISGLDEGEPAPDLIASGSKDPDDEKLGEVDFYFEQGLIDEARQVLFQLRKQYPGSAAIASRLERLDRPEESPDPVTSDAGSEDLDFEVEQALAGKTAHVKPKSKPASKPAAKAMSKPAAAPPRAAPARPVFKMEKHDDDGDGGGDFVDLAAELNRTLDEDATPEPAISETLDGQAHSFEDIFAAFKKGVEQQVESDDFETHYNLGIAYKEMGLVDEAIGELQFAARDPSRTLECCGILGLCFRDKGMPDLAIKWYKRGLDMPGLDEGQSVGLRYDMAEVYREKGDFGEALRAYTEVFGVDSTYRDVTARIKEMKGHTKSSRS